MIFTEGNKGKKEFLEETDFFCNNTDTILRFLRYLL